jgi:small lipoprotein (TIGR04452 family)
MRKIMLACLVVAALVANCTILNPLGLSVDREKGSDAKDRITTASTTNDVLILGAIQSRFGSAFSISAYYNSRLNILSLIAADLASVDDGKFYLKKSVDECVEQIETFGLLSVATLTTGSFTGVNDLRLLTPAISCDLEEDGMILGDPLPKL